MVKTSDDYILVVKQKYDEAKKGVYGGFLNEPSPAKIRDLCLLFYEKGLRKSDLEVFKIFFQINDENNFRRSIENVDVEKLKAVCNFLKGISKKTNINILNVIAVLVDYRFRPFNAFISSSEIETNDLDFEKEVEIEQPKEENTITYFTEIKKDSENNLVTNNNTLVTDNSKKNSAVKKVGIGAFAVLSLFSVVYTAKNMILPEKGCMQWIDDHYEKIDCKIDKLGVISSNEVKPYNEVEFNRKKLKVCDTTTFFKSDKPLVWYSKKNKVVEFFNMDGENPENGCELKKVSQHMIDNYVKPCK